MRKLSGDQGMLLPELRAEYAKQVKARILLALEETWNNKAHAAEKLGINRTTLVEWCKKEAPHLVGPYRKGSKRVPYKG